MVQTEHTHTHTYTHTHTHTHTSERNKTEGRGTMQEIGSITYIRLQKKLQWELEGVISEA